MRENIYTNFIKCSFFMKYALVLIDAAGWGKTSTGVTNSFVDSSTIDPIVTKQLALQVFELSKSNKDGVSMIDAPVSEGVNEAKNGSVIFMVEGANEG